MNFSSRYIRALIHPALALLVVAALSRCSWEESRELAQSAKNIAHLRLGLPTPLQAPLHDCDRESGCICRGATLVAPVSVSQCQPQAVELLPLDYCVFDTGSLDVANSPLRTAAGPISALPISGRQLRALYASLVI